MNTAAREHYLDGFLASVGGSPRRASPAAPPPEPPAQSPPGPPALSWEEEVKQTLFPLDAFPRLLACAGADQPPSAPDRFRFQWFGLFYQGPEQDAFVLRLRLPAGRLRGFQLLGLAEIVQELAGGVVEWNAQGGLDLPGIPVRAGAEALRRVEGIGLSPRGTGGDCVRAVRGADAACWPLVCELEQVLAQSREFADLPGPCEVVFLAPEEPLPVDGAARLTFRAARPAAPSGTPRPEGWPAEPGAETPTWRTLLPGGGELGVALTVGEITPACLGLLRIWSRQADRTNRERAALANFCADLGAGKLRGALEQELGRSLPPSPPPPSSRPPADPAGEALPSLEVPGGRLLSARLAALAGLADQHGAGELRFVAPGRLLVPPGADAAACAAVLRGEAVAETPLPSS